MHNAVSLLREMGLKKLRSYVAFSHFKLFIILREYTKNVSLITLNKRNDLY